MQKVEGSSPFIRLFSLSPWLGSAPLWRVGHLNWQAAGYIKAASSAWLTSASASLFWARGTERIDHLAKV